MNSEIKKNATEVENNKEVQNKEAEPTVPIKRKKVPRRVIHFSDGIVEEFSTDSEDEEEKRKATLIEEGKTTIMILFDKFNVAWSPLFAIKFISFQKKENMLYLILRN